jgi:tellurite methyltransferase
MPRTHSSPRFAYDAGRMPPGTIDRPSRAFQDVSPTDTEKLLADGALALDVRSEREHDELGHIPGSLLLPLPFLASAPAVLPEDGRATAVYCQNGVRSRRAASMLTEAGVKNVVNMTGGLARWTGPLEQGPSPLAGPSSWLVTNVSLAPRGARTLDVACGRGRHALLLASAGFPVEALDSDGERVSALRSLARRLRLPIEADLLDLESGAADLGEGEFELVLVFNYLHRPLFSALAKALRPGGVLLYETFTREQAKRGRPTNPEFLLEPGELPELVAPLDVIRHQEGEFGGQHLAAVAARKPARP